MNSPDEGKYHIGLDVGSTTVKAVVIADVSEQIVWKAYERHETRQPEKVLEFLDRIFEALGSSPQLYSMYMTGSGARTLAPLLGARFVQEVNAVSLAVERRCPEAGSAVELGGQDAKIIIFQRDRASGKTRKFTSMNDKCAGGTGAVIDKINAKLRIPPEELANLGYDGVRLHAVAGKCGVFAETDINSLQKQGVPPDQLMASLFESLVQQNLSVLTRGHTLQPEVLLLGGPNTFIRGMVECWRHNILQVWKERGTELPPGRNADTLIRVPEDAQYYAAIGAVEYGRDEQRSSVFRGITDLKHFIEHDRELQKKVKAGKPLYHTPDELAAFKSEYSIKPFTPHQLQPGDVFRAYLGIDGGSTSTKGVLLDERKRVAFKAYQLSVGNPIEDTIQIVGELRKNVEDQGARLEIIGVGTTGYAKDILKDTISADVALVETVAHTQAAQHYYDDVDVICDVGGQDIKLILLQDGRVSDFKLNTQCSAGNGYFLQSTAEGFGYSVDEYADIAFKADLTPEFGYGCAVFLQSDIVDFQRQGWQPHEIMAGLAKVLPKNIWLYVSQISNLQRLGRTFVLQGGTQRNLAAVKAQVDYLTSRFKGRESELRIIVHEHTGEAGAIGCGVEAARMIDQGLKTSFIGLDAVANIHYTTTRSEATRCYFCRNKCLRTFIDVQTAERSRHSSFNLKSGPEKTRSARFESCEEQQRETASSLPLEQGATRLIIATCEKGTTEDVSDMRAIAKEITEGKKRYPDYCGISADLVWKSWSHDEHPQATRGKLARWKMRIASRKRQSTAEFRSQLRIGIPRVLNLYAHAPFFTAYFAALGIEHKRLVFSDFTNDEMFREGTRRGSIDPCFPSKVTLAHIHQLLFVKHARTPLDFIFFPMVDDMPTDLHNVQASKSCPTIIGTVESVEAAYIKECDLFKERGVPYIDPFINLQDKRLTERQLFGAFSDLLRLEKGENARALEAGYRALLSFTERIRGTAKETLLELERDNRLGILLLARPYHNDPGINHGIPEEFQKLGYPIFTQDSLPTDDETLERVFGADIRAGTISHPMEIRDIWKNSYSENTSRKIWAAKFVARHPNLVALELSSFKCGHDAPIYATVQEIVACSGTPYFSFKDIDENKPAGSIKIRVETIGYFLKRYRETLLLEKFKSESVEAKLRDYESRLRNALERTGTLPLTASGVPASAQSDTYQINIPDRLTMESDT